MKLGDGEKLILWMLSDLYKKLDLKTPIDPEFVQSAILSGNTWALETQYGKGQILGGEISSDIVAEVTDILDMWSFIENAYSRLCPAEKAKLKIEAEPFGRN